MTGNSKPHMDTQRSLQCWAKVNNAVMRLCCCLCQFDKHQQARSDGGLAAHYNAGLQPVSHITQSMQQPLQDMFASLTGTQQAASHVYPGFAAVITVYCLNLSCHLCRTPSPVSQEAPSTHDGSKVQAGAGLQSDRCIAQVVL